jgi:hypothetical protein
MHALPCQRAHRVKALSAQPLRILNVVQLHRGRRVVVVVSESYWICAKKCYSLQAKLGGVNTC